MFPMVFPNRMFQLGQPAWKTSDFVGTVYRSISREIPISEECPQIRTSNMPIFSEDLARANIASGRAHRSA
jgi:hypothetical protein